MIKDNETVEHLCADIKTRIEELWEQDLGAMLNGEVDEFADRIKTAHKREIAELRECLKEAIREKCPFTRMSCKHGEPCDYECGTFKWRKALGEAGGEE